MFEGHRKTWLIYNIECAVVLDGCLTMYLLNIGFVLRELGETHKYTVWREEAVF